jgi:hypothetical protein
METGGTDWGISGAGGLAKPLTVMVANETKQSRWTLLRQPRLTGFAVLFLFFPFFWFVSKAHRPVDFLVCAACSAGCFFLSDFYREFVTPAALRWLHPIVFYLVALTFTVSLAVAVEEFARDWGMASGWSQCIGFMLILAWIMAKPLKKKPGKI